MNNNKKVLIYLSKNKYLLGLLGLFRGKYSLVFVLGGQSAPHWAKKLPDDIKNRIDELIAHSQIFDKIDQTYDSYTGKGIKGFLNGIFSDNMAHEYIKKEVLQDLADMFFEVSVVKKIIKEYDIKGDIDFVPNRFSYSLFNVLDSNDAFLPKNIYVNSVFLMMTRVKDVVSNILYKALILMYPLWAFLSTGLLRKGSLKKYKYGIYLWNSWVASTPGFKHVDFLRNKTKGVNESNALYVLYGRFSKENISYVSRSGYDYIYLNNALGQISSIDYLKHVLPVLVKFIKGFNCLLPERTISTRAFMKAMRTYTNWKAFFVACDVERFVAFQEPGDILRSLIHKNKGIRDDFIYLSTTYDMAERQNMDSPMFIYYSHMSYDSMASSLLSNDLFKKNKNRFGHYYDSGILKSDIIYNIKHSDGLKKEVKKDLGISDDRIVISFFDNVVGNMGMFSFAEGEKMFKDLCKFAESNRDYAIIYKSRGIARIKEGTPARMWHEKLINQNNVIHFSSYNKLQALGYEPQHLMGISDLLIGAITSSVPFEGIVGGVRTICYMPSDRFNKDIFIPKKLPRFCAFGYEELRDGVDYWLNKCTEEDFREYQDKYVKKHIDQFCDGKAKERLLNFLGMN